jgi:hypothetical protein
MKNMMICGAKGKAIVAIKAQRKPTNSIVESLNRVVRKPIERPAIIMAILLVFLN